MVTMVAVVDHAALLGPVGSADTAPTSKTGPSRLEWQGHEYIKINAMELFTLAEQADPADMDRRYVWRAVARRAPGLGQGQFVALRTSVFCCLADAVCHGVRCPDNRACSGRRPVGEALGQAAKGPQPP